MVILRKESEVCSTVRQTYNEESWSYTAKTEIQVRVYILFLIKFALLDIKGATFIRQVQNKCLIQVIKTQK